MRYVVNDEVVWVTICEGERLLLCLCLAAVVWLAVTILLTTTG